MPYLTKAELQHILENAAVVGGGPLWPRVAEDVDWTVLGSGPGTGQWHNLKDLREATLLRLVKYLEEPPNLKVVNVIVGDNPEWTTMELEATGVLKNGKGNYYNRYALIMKWNEEGKVVLVRDYLDTALIASLFANDPE